MDDLAESRTPKAPQPATAIVSHRVHPEKIAAFVEAQTAITNACRRFPGFIGTEVLPPVAGLQEEWIVIFRLESNSAMKRWLDSEDRARLTARIGLHLLEPARVLILASDDHAEPPVAMVFTHQVADDKVPEYLAWRRKTIAAQAHYPGYLATDFFEPHAKSDDWVDIVRYDSLKDLTDWMESRERNDLVRELEPLVISMHAHQVTGLEGWFAINRAPGEGMSGPPSWKQALAVLFALYPTVMVLGYLNPLYRNLALSFPVAMLIGNILSVVLLTWLVMPWVSRLFNFWLQPTSRGWRRETLGICAVALGLALFVLIFRTLNF